MTVITLTSRQPSSRKPSKDPPLCPTWQYFAKTSSTTPFYRCHPRSETKSNDVHLRKKISSDILAQGSNTEFLSLPRCNFKWPINILRAKRDVYIIICRETCQVSHSQSTKRTECASPDISFNQSMSGHPSSFSAREIQYFDTIKFSDISIFLPITSRTMVEPNLEDGV